MARNYNYAAVGWAFETAEGLELPPSESVVLYAYAGCVNADPSTPELNGMAWPGRDALEKKTRLSRRGMQNATAALVKRGLLIPAGRVGKTGQIPRYLLAGFKTGWKAAAVIPVPGETYKPTAPAAERPPKVKPVEQGAAQAGFLPVEDTGINPDLYSPPETPGRGRPLTAKERELDRWGRRQAARLDGKCADGFYRDGPAGPVAEPADDAPADDRVRVQVPRVRSGVYPADHATR